MSVEAWTITPEYTISGTGPYQISHPYVTGAIRAYVQLATGRLQLSAAEFTVSPEASKTTGNLTLSSTAAATHAGLPLIIDRMTPDEQGWLAVLGEREAGLAAQLDRMVQAMQELRARGAGALRTRTALEPFVWAEGTIPILEGGKPKSGPTATAIVGAQARATEAAASATAAAASAGQAALFDGPWLANVAALLANTSLTYTTGTSSSVAVGGFVRTRSEGFSYRVAAASATDHHIVTAGGVKLYIADLRVTFDHYGAIGDGISDDTARMTSAFRGPHSALYARDGANYRFSPITGLNALLRAVVCEGRATFTQILATVGAVGLTVSNRQYFRVANIKFVSSGTKTDGNATVALKFEAGCSLIEIDHGCEFLNHSGRGLQILQCVHAVIRSPKVNTGGYGISLERNGGVPCSTVLLEHPYIFDGTRGISSDGTVGLTVIHPVFEACGATGTVDGALHLIGGRTTIIDPYWEACRRDFVTLEAVFTQLGDPFKSGAAAADSHTFSGTAFADRGFMTLTPTDLRVRRIGPDLKSNNDLLIGTNLTIPVAGGSVKWGVDTMETIKGVAVSGVWTTVKALAGQAGGGENRVSYRYAIYAGTSDLTTGYDTGRILNGVIRSDSGALPAWLRIDAGNLQVLISSSTYGLNYACVLQTTSAIGT